MKHIAVVVAFSLLSGCSLHTMSQLTKVEPIFADVLKQPPLPNSILRDGDDLSYQAQVASSKGSSQPDIAQVRASCTKPQASLMFLESPGTLGPNGQPTRFTVMRSLTQPVVAYLKQNNGFIDACARTPRADWRVVSGSATQRQLLIDRASVKPVGDSTQLWTALDEPLILTHKLKKMPYTQTRMHWQVNCSRHTYRTLAAFSLNENNVVTLGTTETSPQDMPFSSAQADSQTLLNAACSPTLAQLPAATARTKTLETLTPSPLPYDVQQAISALGMPKASKTLRHLKQKRDMGYSPMQVDVYIEQGVSSDQLRTRNVTKYSTHTADTFRGLITLTFQSRYDLDGLSVSAASQIEQLSFTGDWQQLPIGARLGYSTKDLNRNTAEEDRVLERDTTCAVKRELTASKLNSSLTGTAKELNCTATGKCYRSTSTVLSLQDYGYFFTTQSETNGSKTRFALDKVE